MVRVAVTRDEFTRRRLDAIIAREIDPLRVAEFVTHKVQVTFATETHRELANHLVQGNAARHDGAVGYQRGHVGVHFCIHQPESGSLIANERLIVRFGVRDALFAVATVLHGEHQVTHVPVFIRTPLAQDLDPLVRDGHLEAIVETDTAFADRAAKRRHAAHVFRDRRHLAFVESVKHVVGEHEVHHGVDVSGHAKVFFIVTREGDLKTVMLVHHGRHAIETETIKLEFFDPVAKVREQVAHDFPFAVVEASGIPHPMITFRTRVEVLTVATVEHVDAVDGVGRRVRVHQIHEHGEAHGVRLVDQVLQFIGRTASRRHAEEIGDVVAERCVVRVLLNSHQLYGVVTEVFDARQDIVGELDVRVDLRLGGRHPDVRFVNAKLFGGIRSLVLELVLLFFRGIVIDAVERNFALRLHRVLDPSRDAVDGFAVGNLKMNLHARAVRDGRRTVRVVRKEHFEHAVIVLGHPLAILAEIPTVEVAAKARGRRVRRPLSVSDALRGARETHLFIASAELFDATFVIFDRLAQVLELFETMTEVSLVVLQHRVERADGETIALDRRHLESLQTIRLLRERTDGHRRRHRLRRRFRLRRRRRRRRETAVRNSSCSDPNPRRCPDPRSSSINSREEAPRPWSRRPRP
mmetsp:Transcript_386/g.1477  ORF Transcript_386/g.1477 Transcript_386/m.1477 type:complete len:637 (-) Transcript_386:241-2151(-)